MATYRILHGFHKENGVTYSAAGAGKPGGLSGRNMGGDLIETNKNLLALNGNAPGDEQPKFELVTP
jgi:hypothetical protein